MPASERQPGTDRVAPDPASSYGREKPGNEAGQGRLDNNAATPTNRPDHPLDAVTNRQPPRQINAHDDTAPEQPNHSLLDEEPRGEDLAPTDIHDPQQKRHPRTEGKGGTP